MNLQPFHVECWYSSPIRHMLGILFLLQINQQIESTHVCLDWFEQQIAIARGPRLLQPMWRRACVLFLRHFVHFNGVFRVSRENSLSKSLLSHGEIFRNILWPLSSKSVLGLIWCLVNPWSAGAITGTTTMQSKYSAASTKDASHVGSYRIFVDLLTRMVQIVYFLKLFMVNVW